MATLLQKLFFPGKLLVLACFISINLNTFATVYTISGTSPRNIYPTTLGTTPVGGDTIKILSSRTQGLAFNNLSGTPSAPIVIINSGGRVIIDDTLAWGALKFIDCRYIKVSGSGDGSVHYGFSLRAATAGLAFGGLSSDCEVEFVEIHHSGFFGIMAKKDFGGNPPFPLPQFLNLIIHDNYIHHVDEGMYIGETKSPGMELRHVRIFNNVITNCNREAVQLANCVEDVEVYNNFYSTTGTDGLYAQQGSFQIGDNTVGRFYNNMIRNCPGIGIPVFGSGDIEIFNNFVSQTSGVFIDNRTFTSIPSSITVTGNYFYNTITTPVLNSMNGVNEMHIKNNFYNTNGLFAKNKDNSVPVWDESGNSLQPLDSVHYSLQQGLFTTLPSNPSIYNGLGPQAGLTYTMNSTPVIEPVADLYISFGDSLNLTVTASTNDNDRLYFEVRNLPSFITWTTIANGQIVFKGLSSPTTKGVYYPVVLVHDSSNNAFARIKFKIAFKNPSNSAPVLSLNSSYTVEATTKLLLDITAADADNDPIVYTVTQLPAFISRGQTAASTWLQIKPLLADPGDYNFTVVADDGYGLPDTANISLTVTEAALVSGKVIYRINCGGPEIADEPMNWQSDLQREPVFGLDMAYGTGSHSWSGTNTTGAPNNVFGPYRHSYSDSAFSFQFPVPTNGVYEVNLLFAERSTEVASNKTETMRVTVEDSIVLDSFNIYRDYGYKAVRKAFAIRTIDQAVNIDFKYLKNDSKINAIEIRFIEAANNAPAISTIANQTINEGSSDTLAFTVSDDLFPGCDTMLVSISNAPAFVTLQKNGTAYRLIFKPGYTDAGTYTNVTVQAGDGCATSVKKFNITVNDVFLNHAPVLSEITTINVTEGETANYLFSASDADNQLLTFSFSGLPSFVQFIATGTTGGKLKIVSGYSNSGIYPIVISVTDTYLATDSDTLMLTVFDAPVVARIPLAASMITDQVRPPYGSYVSASYLVDEQNLDPTLNQHAVSSSWKPFYNMNFAPYHIYLDLGQEYVIKKLYIHDMNSVANLDFSYGTPGNWTPWFTEPCNSYNNWKLHETTVTTRYIRLSMYTSVYAAVNELAIYGYATGQKSSETGGNSYLPETADPASKPAPDVDSNDNTIKVWPNPASSVLNVSGLAENAKVQIYDLNGRMVMQSMQSELNVSTLASNIYQLTVRSEFGETTASQRIVIE